MKKILKIFFVNILVLFAFLEASSYLGVKSGLFIHPSVPTYNMKSSFIGVNWRNERENWGAWHKKNAVDRAVTSCFDVEYKSNNVGARDDRDYSSLESTRSENIVLIGDSFAEGHGVNINETFAKYLEEYTGKIVLNFGSGGNFGPLQEFIIYRDLASNFQHNEFIFFFVPRNDFTDNSSKYQNTLFKKRYRPYFSRDSLTKEFSIYYPEDSQPSDQYPSASLADYSWSNYLRLVLVNYTYSANLVRTTKQIITSTALGNRNLSLGGYYYEDQESVEGTLHYIHELFLLVPRPVKKAIIVIPDELDLYKIKNVGKTYENLAWFRGMKNIAEIFDANLIDLAAQENIEPEDFVKKWFLPCDAHWSPDGHKMASDVYIKKTR